MSPRPPRELDADGDAERERERYRELLEELRTIMPGVQVLLAFLLTVPFAARFEQLDHTGDVIYLVTLMATTVSVVLFFIPALVHRLSARTSRERRLRVGVQAAVAAVAFLAVAMVAAAMLVVRFIFGDTPGLLVAGAVLLTTLVLWVWLPIRLGPERP